MSILKQSSDSLKSNRKQSSSFGNWFTLPSDRITIIILADKLMGDGPSQQMMKNLLGEISSTYPDLPTNPSAPINRSQMETMVRSLSETYGKPDDKIYNAKRNLNSTASVMKNNIGSMLQNSDKLGDIEIASNDMRTAAQLFSDKGRRLEEKIKRRNRMLTMAIGAIMLFFIIILVMYFT